MMRRLALAAAFLLAAVSVGAAGPNVLNGGTHAASPYIANAITAVLGNGIVDSSIFVDRDGVSIPSPLSIIGDSTNVSAGFFNSAATGVADNHAPYLVMNVSECCSAGAIMDSSLYAPLYAAGAILTYPVAVKVGGAPSRVYPPTSFVAASSTNSGNGGTGWGVEFAIPAGYTNNGVTLDTTADSWVSAEMAGFLAALKYSHPTWTWFDIKAALRQTAANWSTGYSHANFGYGSVNWAAANAVSSPASLYLQPPGLQIQDGGYYATVTLYPFRQTRRQADVVYAVNSSYTWPIKNEYTAADISASGATLLYTSNGTDVTPSFTYTPVASGTVNLVAFTTDGSGNYSRVEEFSVLSEPLIVGTACLK